MTGRRVKAGKADSASASAHRRRKYYEALLAEAKTPWEVISVKALHVGAAIRHAPPAVAAPAAAAVLEQMDRTIRELDQGATA